MSDPAMTINIARRISSGAMRFECAQLGCRNEVETAIGHDAIEWAADQLRRFPAKCNTCNGARRRS